MAAPTTCTITLTANSIGASPTQLRNAMDQSVVPAEVDMLHLLGATISSDNTAAVGTTAVRTIVLNIDQPPILSSFKNNPQPAEFQGCIFSDSDEDSPNGQGCQQIQINYRDANGNPQSEVVNLQGKTPINLTNTDHLQIDDPTIVAAAGGLSNAGRIYIFSGTRIAAPGESGAPNNVRGNDLWEPTGVCVAVVPQPSYRLVTTPAANTVQGWSDMLTKLFIGYMRRKLAISLGIPIISSKPVFA